MEAKDSGGQLLKNKYDLHKQPEVDAAARRSFARTGEKVPQNPMVRIQNYLDRFHEITDREDPQERQCGIDAIKRLVISKFVTKVEDIPENYWQTQERLIRERGQRGDYDRFSDQDKLKWKQELAEGLLDDQRASLEQWIDYLASPDSSSIPDAMKYWIFRNIVDMQEYDKEAREFPKRSKGTVKMFPDINEEALSYVVNAVVGKYGSKDVDFGQFNFDLTDEAKQQFRQALSAENFAKLYAWANEYIQPISASELTITEGQWVRYPQDNGKTESYRQLSQSLRGRGTGWCTAGEYTAKTQLKGGDFYVYYSNDTSGNPTNPRIAISMEQDRIAEIRGISARQNLDPYMNDILVAKLEEFSDKDQYLKKEADMRRLTEIDNKAKSGLALDRDDLIFLYELNSPIEGFGNENLGVSSDPRIKELRDTRNPDQDMLVIFNCEPSQIAQKANEINEHTKAYVGTLEPGIFDRIREYDVEHVYTKFPEGRIRFEDLEIGGKTAKELKKQLDADGINVSSYADDLLQSRDFATLPNSQSLSTVRLKVSDLGFSGYPTTDQVYAKAKELGLDLCPAETGPHLRLKYKANHLDEWFYIGMKPIADSDGYPFVFLLARSADGLWLRDHWAYPGSEWDPRGEFVFSLRK